MEWLGVGAPKIVFCATGSRTVWAYFPQKLPFWIFFRKKVPDMGGRNKEPTDLLLVKGKKHLTKAEIEERKAQEIKAPADNVQAPSYLPDELKEEFDRIALELIDIGIMSNLDSEALARNIVAESQYQKVSVRLMKMKTFGAKYMELLKIQKELFKQARDSASDLGLTISSRCKLVVPKKNDDDKPKSKWEKFM